MTGEWTSSALLLIEVRNYSDLRIEKAKRLFAESVKARRSRNQTHERPESRKRKNASSL